MSSNLPGENKVTDPAVSATPVKPTQPRSYRVSFARRAAGAMVWAGPKLGRIGPLRRKLINNWEKKMRTNTEKEKLTGFKPPGIYEDRLEVGVSILKTVERVLAGNRLSPAGWRKFLNILVGDALINQGDLTTKQRFTAKFGVNPPEILLISPTKSCNLFCKGCYSDSGQTGEKLEWDIIDRLIQEAHDLWGARFIVLSGGEPLVYKDKGKTVLDLVEKHSGCYFMMYTNGTLIDDEMAKRMGELGNLSPAVSVEGLRERTDRRRGNGIFDQILAAMERLRREKVFFGVSMTVTKENAEEVLSDEVIDFFFNKMGALYGWIFQYMPIGRAFTLDLLPTPEQRLWMWKRSWEIVYNRHLFIADFWNSGTAAHGCISAGREGGYMTVDWNGAVSPCVFLPYSPLNIHDVYAQGKNLIDVWSHPFFAKLRSWQYKYGYRDDSGKQGWAGNLMMPCPIRDHYAEMYPVLKEFNPTPVDENAAAALTDPEYRQGLIDYNSAVAKLFDPIWKSRYLRNHK